jgi:hypothetical protein
MRKLWAFELKLSLSLASRTLRNFSNFSFQEGEVPFNSSEVIQKSSLQLLKILEEFPSIPLIHIEEVSSNS